MQPYLKIIGSVLDKMKIKAFFDNVLIDFSVALRYNPVFDS